MRCCVRGGKRREKKWALLKDKRLFHPLPSPPLLYTPSPVCNCPSFPLTPFHYILRDSGLISFAIDYSYSNLLDTPSLPRCLPRETRQ